MARENIEVGVELNDHLSGPAKRAEMSLDELKDVVRDLAVQLEASERGINKLTRQVNQYTRAVGKAAVATKKLGNEEAKAALKAEAMSKAQNKAAKSTKKSKIEFDNLGKTVLRWVGIAALGATAVTFLAGTVNGLGAALVAGVGGLSQFGGLLQVYPSWGLAAAESLGVVKLATHGVSDAIKAALDPTSSPEELAKAFKDLSPAAREFAQEAAALARGPLKQLRQNVQQAFFSHFRGGLDDLTTLVPIFNKQLSAMGAELGTIARRGTSLFASGPWKADLSTIMGRNVKLMDTFGFALFHVLGIFKNLTVAAGPAMQRLADFMETGLKALDDLTGKNRASIGRWFDKMEYNFERLMKTVGDFSAGFYGVFKGAQPLTQELAADFEKMGVNFRKWVSDPINKAKMDKFFTDMIPVVEQTGKLVWDLVKALFQIGQNSHAADLMKQLDTELLPALTKAISGFGDQLGPAIIDIATAGVEFAGALSNPLLISAVSTIASFIKSIADAIEAMPGPLKNVLITFVTVRSILTGIKTLLAGRGLLRSLAGKGSKGGGIFGLLGSLVGVGGGGKAKKAGFFGKLASKVPIIGKVTGALAGRAGLLAGLTRVAGFLGGPWGIAISTGISLGIPLIKHFLTGKDAAEQYREKIEGLGKQMQDSFSSGDYTADNLSGTIKEQLYGSFKNLIPIMAKTGLTIDDVTQYVLGNQDAHIKVSRAMHDLTGKEASQLSTGLDTLSDSFLNNKNGIIDDAIVMGKGKEATDLLNGRITVLTGTVKGVNTEFHGTKVAVEQIPGSKDIKITTNSAAVTKELDTLFSHLNQATNRDFFVNIGLNIVAPNKTTTGESTVAPGTTLGGLLGVPAQRFMGGPVEPNMDYLVGEYRPEVYFPNIGAPQIIGADGPELRKFNASGTIVPSVPQAQAIVEKVGARSGGGDDWPMLPAPVISVTTTQEVDVEAAVERAYRKMMREWQEKAHNRNKPRF